MYYEPGISAHGLPFDPFKSCVIPRPIGWISTRSRAGLDNLAPYSQFTNVTYDPPVVLFSANQTPEGHHKDTVLNVMETGQFVWNMATWELRHAVNISAEQVPRGVDEFERAGLEKAMSVRVNAPRVAASPVQFECEVLQIYRIEGNGAAGSADIVIGRVVAIHIADRVLNERGKIDALAERPIARMGYFDYCSIESSFEMLIPGDPRLLQGLEGVATREDST